jgi:hypothetical protein
MRLIVRDNSAHIGKCRFILPKEDPNYLPPKKKKEDEQKEATSNITESMGAAGIVRVVEAVDKIAAIDQQRAKLKAEQRKQRKLTQKPKEKILDQITGNT